MKYTHKRNKVNAIRLIEKNVPELKKEFGVRLIFNVQGGKLVNAFLKTETGAVYVNRGDYIVFDEYGCFPLGKSEFKRLYEPIKK